MCPATNNPASCEIHVVTRFLHAKNMGAVEIHCELCTVLYGENVMGEGTAIQRCRMFKDGRTNVYDEGPSGQPSVVSMILFKVLTKKHVKDGTSQLQNFSVNFHKFHTRFSTRLSQLG
jgi:hypothetical protein